MRAYERLLRYAAVNTTSFREGEGTPTGKGQFDLAYLLEKEMKDRYEELVISRLSRLQE